MSAPYPLTRTAMCWAGIFTGRISWRYWNGTPQGADGALLSLYGFRLEGLRRLRADIFRRLLTKRETPRKITLVIKTMMGRKTGTPASREPADAASRRGSPADDCSRSFPPERAVGRDGWPRYTPGGFRMGPKQGGTA